MRQVGRTVEEKGFKIKVIKWTRPTCTQMWKTMLREKVAKIYVQYDSIYDFKIKLYVVCVYITHFLKKYKTWNGMIHNNSEQDSFPKKEEGDKDAE